MSERITAEQLLEWRRLDEKATPGPWTNQRMEEGHLVIFAAGGNDLVAVIDQCPDEDEVREVATACFVAASRTAVPALIAEVERLREALKPFLPAHTAYVQTVQNWICTGDTLADRRASASECRSTAEEAAHEAFARITILELHAVYETIGARAAQQEDRDG